MPFSYSPIKNEIALRLAQLAGYDQASLETAYTAYDIDGAEIPASSIKSMVLMIEKEIATVIATNPNHPARSMLYARSTDLASLANTPVVDNNGVEWVGVFDSVCDSATGKPLTLLPPQSIEDLNNEFFNDTTFLNYSQFGNQVQTVTENVPLYFYQGCSWSYATQSGLYDADGDSPLPQVCANMLVNGVCANAGQVGWVDNANQIQQDINLYQQGLQLLSTGLPNIPLASAASPTVG